MQEKKRVYVVRKIFTLLFIISIFLGVAHELSHEHCHGETCEVCLVAHTPGVLSETLLLIFTKSYFEAFDASFNTLCNLAHISLKNRSPPQTYFF